MTDNRPDPSREQTLKKEGFAEEALPHLDAVYRFALRLSSGNTAEAEDVAQEAFLRAFRAWETYTPGTNCRAWLFTICRNIFRRRRSRLFRRQEHTASDLNADVEALAATTVFDEVRAVDPERTFFDSFVDDEVLAAVDQLPVEFREVVIMSDLEGMSYADMAEALELPLGTVKSRLYRGRRLLQQALYQYALEMGYVAPKPNQ